MYIYIIYNTPVYTHTPYIGSPNNHHLVAGQVAMLKTWVALTTQVPGSGQGLGRPIVDQENRPFASLW